MAFFGENINNKFWIYGKHKRVIGYGNSVIGSHVQTIE